MDIDLVEQRRLDAEAGRLRAHIGTRRVDRLLHHVAQLAGGLEATLARQHDGLDGQRFAADFGPGQPGNDTDLVFAFHLAEAMTTHAGIGAQIVRRDFQRLGLL